MINQYNSVVVFDGSCGFCRKSLTLLKTKFGFSEFLFIPFSQKDAEKWNFPQEVILNYDKYMYVITKEGDLHRGFFSFKYLFQNGSNLKFINRALDSKVIETLGRLIYRIIANNRRMLSGRNSRCGL